MPEAFKLRRKSVLLGCTAITAVMFANAAMADDLNAPETVVVTGTRFNTDAAPAKASLDTTQPQTIINRAYIEDFVQPQADYVTILSIVPSLTGGDINGAGLSDGGTKNTLRGLPDGMFNMTYDGVPFGDTNGPTHHNISYFPASTIGSAIVDRGPGNAGTIGAATYGGSINLFSEGLTDDMHTKVLAGFGSFNTYIENVNFQSGAVSDFGVGTVKAMVNLQNLDSEGGLTGQDVHTHNVLLKVQDDINSHWTITLFGDLSFLKENLDDNNGATPAQIFTYGKNFALQGTDATLPTYTPYNYTSKQTDLDYFRVTGDLLPGVKLDNTTYTYAYWNHTFSPNCETQTLAQIQADSSCDNASVKLINGTTDAKGLLAYSKENAYRVYGDILRFSEDYDFGWVSGQVREGVWWETQATHRFKYYYDMITCANDGIDPFDVGTAAASAACGVKKGTQNGVLGYAKDDEYSDWTQYQPFLEVDIKPLDNLTITPGVKYVHWDHGVNAPVEQGNGCGVGLACPPYNAVGQDFRAGFINRDVLPFAEVNYKIEPSWSVYGQYAKGIYVPDISSFETSGIPTVYPAPETTTNYQLGTVYYADSFTFDADLYYIGVNNNIIDVPCAGDPSDTCADNDGRAIYKGLEGEGTYAFGDELMNMWGVDLHGLSVFANGALMSSKQTSGAFAGFWEPGAPRWTAAAGILYKNEHWKFALIDKLVGPQYSDTANVKYYELHSYANLNTTLGYSIGPAELDVSIDNLLDSRKNTLITEAVAGVPPASWQTSSDQYFFQPPRTVMATLKVRF